MSGFFDNPDRVRKTVVLLLTLAVSVIFFHMIRGFMIALFLAAVFTGMTYPLHHRILVRLNGRRSIAAMFTLMIVTLIAVLPLLVLLGVVAEQGLQLSDTALPWIQEHLKNTDDWELKVPESVPFHDRIHITSDDLMQKAGELASKAGQLLFSNLTAATQGTATFFLHFFVMLYAMFYFLREGPALRDRAKGYIPLPNDVKQRLMEKGTSVTRATIKGTLVIGAIQGLLGGIGLAVVGIHAAAFWGTVMMVLSVIPGIGTALVWVPAVIYLFVTGEPAYAIGLAIWSAVVVSSIDNILRPKLVGGDTQMPDLLILISTFGGLAAFGAVGLIVGPTLAAMFVTVWDIFGQTFGDTIAKAEQAS